MHTPLSLQCHKNTTSQERLFIITSCSVHSFSHTHHTPLYCPVGTGVMEPILADTGQRQDPGLYTSSTEGWHKETKQPHTRSHFIYGQFRITHLTPDAWLWMVEGSWSIWSKPTQTQEEHTERLQPGMWGDSANHCPNMLPCCVTFCAKSGLSFQKQVQQQTTILFIYYFFLSRKILILECRMEDN